MEFDEHWIGAVGEARFGWKTATLRLGLAKAVGDREAYDFIVDRGRRCWLRVLQRVFAAAGDGAGEGDVDADLEEFVSCELGEGVGAEASV